MTFCWVIITPVARACFIMSLAMSNDVVGNYWRSETNLLCQLANDSFLDCLFVNCYSCC